MMPARITAFVLIAAGVGCSLLVDDLGSFSSGQSEPLDGAALEAASAEDVSVVDAAVPTDAEVDADAAPSRRCAHPLGPEVLLCEDFDTGYDATKLGKAYVSACGPSDAVAFSLPNALRVATTQAAGGCSRQGLVFPNVARGVRLSFRIRFDTIASRVHAFTLETVATEAILFVSLYPDRVGLGQGTLVDGGYAYAERSTVNRTIPTGKWLDVELTVAGLDSAARSSLVVDGTQVEKDKPLLYWAPGSVSMNFGVPFTQNAASLAVDDVKLESL